MIFRNITGGLLTLDVQCTTNLSGRRSVHLRPGELVELSSDEAQSPAVLKSLMRGYLRAQAQVTLVKQPEVPEVVQPEPPQAVKEATPPVPAEVAVEVPKASPAVPGEKTGSKIHRGRRKAR